MILISESIIVFITGRPDRVDHKLPVLLFYDHPLGWKSEICDDLNPDRSCT